MCDRVIVMYAGRMVESAPCEAFYQQPCHPYSQGLLGSIPHLQSQAKSPLKAIPGFVPTFADMPAGCRFNNRCPHKQTQCEQQPLLTAVNQQRQVACWRWREIA
jgi:oligopeptide/dipeptide ABC transporter ATP-binding protein